MLDTVFALTDNLHVLIVDDGSPDGTAQLVKNAQKQYGDKLHILERSGKLGLGTAYIAGFRWGLERDYTYICEMDCDFSHNPKDLLRLIAACEAGADVSVGSRYVKGGKVENWPFDRIFISYGASVYVRAITWMPVKDPTAGFVCYHRKVLDTIDLDKIRFIGYAFQIEMKFASRTLGFKIKEVPITFTDRVEGTSKMSKGIINLLIVVSSYVFYGHWDKRFLLLILFSTVVDFLVGQELSTENDEKKRKYLLWTSILVNLGFLAFFKYFNFFLDNFVTAFSFFGTEISTRSLNIILPVGISFYTFQTLSYTIDVYKRRLTPTNDFIAFSAFVSFFPQLVAGPIERATHLLPQFYQKRSFDYDLAVNGMRQILWGLFKKIVIADGCAQYANQIFNNSDDYSGSTLIMGAVLFAFQIYGDFSGYSDIAIGTSRLFGFDLMKNFNFPYFSRDIAEFWRRWHISLSTWFRDYVYIPLGGSRGGTWMRVRNTFIIFLVSGFWHGPNWTFVAWGGLNALYFLPLLLTKNNRNNLDTVGQDSNLPSIKELFNMLLTFALTTLAWVFFRAEDMGHALSYLGGIFDRPIIKRPQVYPEPLIYFVIGFVLIEWFGRREEFAMAKISRYKAVRWFCYLAIILLTYFFGNFSENIEFIYFQF